MATSPEPTVITDSAGTPPHPPLVLIADDDRALRKLLNLALQQEGYRVAQASNGEQAIQDFERLRPDLVLLDAVMPDRDGFDCCRHLRTVLGSDVPILMVTVLDDQASVDQAFEAGATDYITKPIHWAVLSQRVKRLVSGDRALKQIQAVQAELGIGQTWETVQRQILASIYRHQPLARLLADVLPSLLRVFNADGLWVYDGATTSMLKLDGGAAAAQAPEPVAPATAAMLKDFPTPMGEGFAYPQSNDVTLELAGLERLQPLADALTVPAVLMSPMAGLGGERRGWLFMVRQRSQGWTPADRHRSPTLALLLGIEIASSSTSGSIFGGGDTG